MKINKFYKKHSLKILIAFILLLGLIVRIALVPYFVRGDLLSYAEWGEGIWKYGLKNFYFGDIDWYYSAPNYMPLSSLLFSGLFWLFDHKYVLAQLHNLIKIPPAFFIVYFYEYGYILLLKLISILADLGLGLLVYKLIYKFSKNSKKALFGLAFFVLNPAAIFISGGWGQTDSLVAFFGLVAFILLAKKKTAISLPLFFISLYLKPSWGIFIPFYLYLLFITKPKRSNLLNGVFLSFMVFLLGTTPFAQGNIIGFTQKLLRERISFAMPAAARASISAFNFHTIFLLIDRSFANARIIGIPANIIGYVAYFFVNLFSFKFIARHKNKVFAVVVGIFTIGLGSFLFLTSMLERYFFPALAPLIILMFTRPKTFWYGVLINVIVFANVIWSFFRREFDEIDHPFTNNNFLLIRTLSIFAVVSWVYILRKVKMLQFMRGGENY